MKCLKELPLEVCIVCARRTSGPSPLRGTIVNNVDPGRSKQAFASRVSYFDTIYYIVMRVQIFIIAYQNC